MPTGKNNWIRDYFTFSQKDRRAVVLLLIMTLLFAFLPSLFPFLIKKEVLITVDTVTEKKLAGLALPKENENYDTDEKQFDQWKQPKSNSYPDYNKTEKGELFSFNPNTASPEIWKRLGLKEKTIQTILNYRSKGGKFKQPEDLKRIYGLPTSLYERLLPYIKIETDVAGSAETVNNSLYVPEKKYEAREIAVKPIDINLADTAIWKTLKGIGSGYAKRIVNYRNKLGGFYKIEQVAETFGLPDSVFQKIKPFLLNGSGEIRKLNINNSSADELKAHPYISFSIANAIVQYRNQHGNFEKLNDLLKIGIIDDVFLARIAPYLSL